jgi:hypothetical protein
MSLPSLIVRRPQVCSRLAGQSTAMHLSTLLTLLMALGASGCSSKSLPEISGHVTFGGKPLVDSIITFFSADADSSANGSPEVTTKIVNGHFHLLADVGEKRIAIEGYEKQAGSTTKRDAYPAARQGVASIQFVPDKFNVKSELRYTVTGSASDVNFQL